MKHAVTYVQREMVENHLRDLQSEYIWHKFLLISSIFHFICQQFVMNTIK